MILDVVSDFLSSTLSVPGRLATIFISALMFVCGTAFLVIATLLLLHATSIRAAAVLVCLFLALSAASYWFFYRAICELRKSTGGA
jgi:hypothetical protein